MFYYYYYYHYYYYLFIYLFIYFSFLVNFLVTESDCKKKQDLKFPEINEKFCACVFQFKDILHYCGSWQSNGHPFGHAVQKVSPIMTDFSPSLPEANFNFNLVFECLYAVVFSNQDSSTSQKRHRPHRNG